MKKIVEDEFRLYFFTICEGITMAIDFLSFPIEFLENEEEFAWENLHHPFA